MILCLFSLTLFLSACSNSEGTSEKVITEEDVTAESNTEVSDLEQLIGEHIIMEGSSIELPFDGLVRDAHFSEDGRVKLFVTKDMIIVIDDTEIVHVSKAISADIFSDPTVSFDGKYAVWRRDAAKEDYAIAIFDVENRTIDYVESTDKYDVFGVYLYLPLIEKVEDEYFLVMNHYLYGYDVAMALNVTTKEMYSKEYPEDQEVLSKLKQEPVYSGDETYVPMVENWANVNNLSGQDSSYYGYYEYFFEADSEAEIIEQIYAVYTPEPKVIDLELDKHGIDLSDQTKQIDFRNDIIIADNGSFVFTQYEQNEEEAYKMFTYYIDLANTPVEPVLVHESEFNEAKKDVFYNHDAKGIYIVEKGKLNFFELN
ncbi:hypothetical protein [Bacillus sp. JCM 19034]|uniref:hypothetical protein n=1 Tax=Bacillus sp. JCM 19034 TaxID=1481928 RepID=UPI00078233E4|nr:hypothetical protein [Bacillus sp. JCM 19034]